MKKGDIWIATVIYIAIGIVTLTLIVSTGVPLINDMRDRNTFIQSKEVMHAIDDAISEVISDGPGSRRALNPIIIKKGELSLLADENKVFWAMETKTKVQEVSPTNVLSDAIVVKEKNLQIIEYNHEVLVDYYIVKIILDYTGKNIKIISDGKASKLTGKFGLIISNEGIKEISDGASIITIKIRVI